MFLDTRMGVGEKSKPSEKEANGEFLQHLSHMGNASRRFKILESREKFRGGRILEPTPAMDTCSPTTDGAAG